jgi:hypothetical protein
MRPTPGSARVLAETLASAPDSSGCDVAWPSGVIAARGGGKPSLAAGATGRSMPPWRGSTSVGDPRFDSAAWTAALGGSDHRFRSLAARPVEDSEGTAWPSEVPEQSGQPSVEVLQSPDPIGDLCAPLLDHARQLRGRVRTVPGVAPARDLRRVLEREIEAAKVDDQAKVLDVRWTVLPIGIVAPTRSREPARAFVEAHGVRRNADGLREFTDPHANSKPWSGSDVNGPCGPLSVRRCRPRCPGSAQGGHDIAGAMAAAASTWALSRSSSRAGPAFASIASIGDSSRHMPWSRMSAP